eukprot:m.17957 g.17957  ORF g.17957 m.17957 type:complete len:1180 (+) comp6152_c0_seq1:184-3723(+)
MKLPTAVISLLLLGSTAQGMVEIFPSNIKLNAYQWRHTGPIVDPNGPVHISWEVGCDNNGKGETENTLLLCRGAQQVAYSVELMDGNSNNVLQIVNDTKNTQRITINEDFVSNTLYVVKVTIKGMTNNGFEQTSSRSIKFRTALLSQAWANSSWIGGFTQLRGSFTTKAQTITSATIFASGVGCFSLEVNGQNVDNTTFLSPGWANLPTVRNLYQVFNITDLILSGTLNVIGARLGFCKYGYLGSFCEGGDAFSAICRGFRSIMNITYSDGSVAVFATNPGGSWEGTTSANPITYTHLYHGEWRNNQIGSKSWSSPSDVVDRVQSDQWFPAIPFAKANSLGTIMTMLAMPPIAATETHSPVNITSVHTTANKLCTSTTDKDLVAVKANEGDVLNLSCVAHTGTIKIQFASYGNPSFPPSGRFVGGSLPNGSCADPSHVPGCIFWESFANKSRHFVKECVTTPCMIDACNNFTQIGSDVLNYTAGPDFTCDNAAVSCERAASGGCSSNSTLSILQSNCDGKLECSIKVTDAVFGDPCPNTKHTLLATVTGCQLKSTTPAAYVFDFGQNMAGFAKLNVTGPNGTVLTLRYAEVLKADGSVDMNWGQTGDGTDCCGGLNCANQTDIFVLNGSQEEIFTPSFTYHGFRYVQIDGLPPSYTPSQHSLTALFVHTAVSPRGNVQFNSSFEILNKIQKAYRYTQLSNYHSHPTDCPTREKRGWMGDSQITSLGASLNFDTREFYRNWLQTFRDHQIVNCALHSTTPVFPQANVDKCCNPKVSTFGCSYTGIPDTPIGGGFNETIGSLPDVVPFTYIGGWPGDPSWGAAGVTIPWALLTSISDKDTVKEFYNVSKSLALFFDRHGDPTKGGLLSFGYYGDWLSLEHIDKSQVVAWTHVLVLARMVDLATATGVDNSTWVTKLANGKQAYHNNYWDASHNEYIGGSQTAQLLPLYLDIPPTDATKKSAISSLIANLVAHKNCTTSGIIGNAYLLQVLEKVDPNMALNIATSVEMPSWGYMVMKGPGTIWESWTDSTNSYNHPALGATISVYLYNLVGFHIATPDELISSVVTVGVQDISVAKRLGQASGHLHTVHGLLKLSWETTVDNNQDLLAFSLNTSIPHSLEGDVHVLKPDCENLMIMETISNEDVLQSYKREDQEQQQERQQQESIVLRVPSGEYRFIALCRT